MARTLDGDQRSSVRVRAARLVRSASIAPIALLVAYVAMSFLLGEPGYLSTDTGAKVATLDVMSETGSWFPEVPYWADELDPEGEAHPFYSLSRNDRGEWVGVTTVPMLLLARPLYDVGGLRFALVLPMLGSVLAAMAARRLAQLLGASDDGVLAFWVVGLASPMAVYALDFWEHSIGVALVAWAVVALTGAVLGRRGPLAAGLLAGAAFGAAFSMRTESVVYGAVAFAVVCIHVLRRRGLRPSVVLGATGAAAFGVLALAGRLLESAVHAQNRSDRAGSAADTALGNLDTRWREAWQTLLALDAAELWRAVAMGACLVAAIVVGVVAERRGERTYALAAAVAGAAVLAVRITDGYGFVPGLLAAGPVAVLGFLAADDRTGRRLVVAIAVAALPLVWATQYVGGAGPQWGGRYILATGALLTAVGLSARRADVSSRAVAVVAAMAVAITALGVGWTGERARVFDRYFDAVLAQPEDVIISTNPFLPQNAGPRIFDARFLTSEGNVGLDDAADVARRAGECRVGVIGWTDDPPPVERLGGAATLVEVRPLPTIGGQAAIAVYDLC